MATQTLQRIEGDMGNFCTFVDRCKEAPVPRPGSLWRVSVHPALAPLDCEALMVILSARPETEVQSGDHEYVVQHQFRSRMGRFEGSWRNKMQGLLAPSLRLIRLGAYFLIDLPLFAQRLCVKIQAEL